MLKHLIKKAAHRLGYDITKASSSRCAPSPEAPKAAPSECAAPCRGYYDSFFNAHGVLLPVHELAEGGKIDFSFYYAYKSRAEVALDVCSLYDGGDYIEFGSDSVGTLRNFLASFMLYGMDKRYPDTKFYGFDIFGEFNDGTKIFTSDYEEKYFLAYDGKTKYQECIDFLSQYGEISKRCTLVKGYFENTITDDFKEPYITDNRKAGFFFLDCNITRSYETVFNNIIDIAKPPFFIYMDEYFCNDDVPVLFDSFINKLPSRQGVQARYMRNAGAFGALFKVLPGSRKR